MGENMRLTRLREAKVLGGIKMVVDNGRKQMTKQAKTCIKTLTRLASPVRNGNEAHPQAAMEARLQDKRVTDLFSTEEVQNVYEGKEA
jgi:hypothetical protein